MIMVSRLHTIWLLPYPPAIPSIPLFLTLAFFHPFLILNPFNSSYPFLLQAAFSAWITLPSIPDCYLFMPQPLAQMFLLRKPSPTSQCQTHWAYAFKEPHISPLYLNTLQFQSSLPSQLHTGIVWFCSFFVTIFFSTMLGTWKALNEYLFNECEQMV